MFLVMVLALSAETRADGAVTCSVAVRGEPPHGGSTYTNPLLDSGADPWALWHDGYYYYMHTMGDRLVLWKTEDITDLRHARQKTVWVPTDPANSHDLWAPEIHRIDGKWYIYYAADDGNTDNHQLYVLENVNEDPLDGEFVMKGRISTDEKNNWAIDGSVFSHRGKLYMVWSGWQARRVDTEVQCIYIARMKNPWTLDSERVLISRPEMDWERNYVNEEGWTPSYKIFVNEGPQPLKSPRGKYIHIAYSASGVWTPYYALGLLTARADADLLDPDSWKKSPEPVFRQSPENGVYCTGHNSFFLSPDGTEHYILYHACDSPASMVNTRSPRAQKMEWTEDDYPLFGTPLPVSAVMKKPSGTPAGRMMYGDTTRIGVPFSKDPHVVKFKGSYLMYYSIPPARSNTDLGWNIGIACSKDLVNWTKVGEITPHPDAPYEKNGLCAPGALVKDGKVHLFYQTYGNGPKDAICHAVSADGIHFERDASNPIFAPTGDWNCGRAIDAEVCSFGGKYYLYFATRDPEFKVQMQGVAVAPADTDFGRDDWTLAADGPILKPELPWEGDCIEGASIVQKDGRLFMFYAGNYNNLPQQVGVAVSEDGVHWTRLSDQPFVPNGKPGEWNSSESGHPHLFADEDGRTYLFFQGNNDGGKTWYITQREVVWQDGMPRLKE